MDIYDLLDNSETIQLKILRKIFSAGGRKGLHVQKFKRSLKINANTVLEAVGLFNDFFKETYVDRKVGHKLYVRDGSFDVEYRNIRLF